MTRRSARRSMFPVLGERKSEAATLRCTRCTQGRVSSNCHSAFPSRWLTTYNGVTHNNCIHTRAQEAIERLLGRVDNRFVLVEAGIQQYGHACDLSELGDQ